MVTWRIPAASLLLLGVAAMSACTELEVTNPNDPDTGRVLSNPADVENLITDAYQTWYVENHAYEGVGLMMSVMAFEHSATAANAGMEERGRIPRIAINNSPSDAFAPFYEPAWFKNYSVISSANQGLQRLAAGLTLGDAATDARAKAFAYFMQGLGHGMLALIFDQAFIYTDDIDIATTPLQIKPYGEVMTAALGMLDKAITAAGSEAFTLDAGWINGNPLSNTDFIKVIKSYQARFRAEVARNPTERGAVNWDRVIADVDGGITTDLKVDNDGDTWYDEFSIYANFPGAWSQLTFWIHGMADGSGAYQTWVNTPTESKQPFLLVTTDRRFPQGSTVAAQQAAPGKYIAYTGTVGHLRAERGTWRWSFYRDIREADYLASGYVDLMPEITVAEMRLLKAEGLLRKTQLQAAADLINVTRVGNGGLPAVTTSGVPQAPNCVPKLPNGSCGSLLEALKWEKRIETYHTRIGAWFFDSRGWGDHMEGTPLHFPVPAKELQTLQMSVYTTGGATAQAGAPKGTYGF